MKKLVIENIIKNVFIALALFWTYFPMKEFLMNAPACKDLTVVGNLLVAVSIIAVTACFGHFAFSYENTNMKRDSSRLIAYLVTVFLMTTIGMALEMTIILVRILVGEYYMWNMVLLFLYTALVLYDFWDLQRAKI